MKTIAPDSIVAYRELGFQVFAAQDRFLIATDLRAPLEIKNLAQSLKICHES